MFAPVHVSRVVTYAAAQATDKPARPPVATANDIVAKHVPGGLFISGFKLAVSSDNSNCPADRIREIYGRGDNVNQGRGENYVYIVPTRTNTYSDAITSARIRIPVSYDSDDSPSLPELTMFQLAISNDNANHPADRARDIYNRGDNVKQGRGENCGYIVPSRTNKYSSALVGTRNATQVSDLASEASGRCLVTRKEKGKAPIVDWCLFRGRERIPPGWHCKTVDLNQDCPGDYLYLCSKLW